MGGKVSGEGSEESGTWFLSVKEVKKTSSIELCEVPLRSR